MVDSVPVVAAPAEIDISTAEQRAHAVLLAAASYEEARAGGTPDSPSDPARYNLMIGIF
jgi:hypothetical protein